MRERRYLCRSAAAVPCEQTGSRGFGSRNRGNLCKYEMIMTEIVSDQHSQSWATVDFRLISGLSRSSLSHIWNPPAFIVVPARAVCIWMSSFQGDLAVAILTSCIPAVNPFAVSIHWWWLRLTGKRCRKLGAARATITCDAPLSSQR